MWQAPDRAGQAVVRSASPLMTVHVLVIDDDVRLFEVLDSYLTQNGVRSSHASNGLSGLSVLESGAFDAVLLDVMMPGLDGLAVSRRSARRATSPSSCSPPRATRPTAWSVSSWARTTISGKPFSPRELLARLRAVLRRTELDPSKEHLNVGDVSFDVGARQVTVDGKIADLTGIEFDLLLALMRRAGRVVPRASLLEQAGRSDVTVSERTVDVHISHLRKKLRRRSAALDQDRARRRLRDGQGLGMRFRRFVAPACTANCSCGSASPSCSRAWW